jgi:23S rRNA-/tRNA-specific pseudouridylate synthase
MAATSFSSSFVVVLPNFSYPHPTSVARRMRWNNNMIPNQDDVSNISNMNIPIIYENDRLLAIDKPHGISHHDNTASSSGNELGILSLIRKQQATNTFPYPHRLYGVHRLDYVTSGILLLAKDITTANLLVNKFRNKEISKWYIGISGRKPTKKKQGWVRGQLVKGRRGSYKLVNNDNGGIIGNRLMMMDKKDNNGIRQHGTMTTTTIDNDNDEFDDEVVDEVVDENDDSSCQEQDTTKEQGVDTIKNGSGGGGGNIGYAETRFYTAGLGNLLLHPSLLVNNDQTTNNDKVERQSRLTIPRTLILFQPHTGKTHQLRVAAKSLAMPLLGDTRYGGGRLRANMDDNDDDDDDDGNWDRTYLHASAIHFNLENNDVTIWSPPPFHHLTTTGLEDVYLRLMDKHCNCPQIVDAIKKHTTTNNNKE